MYSSKQKKTKQNKTRKKEIKKEKKEKTKVGRIKKIHKGDQKSKRNSLLIIGPFRAEIYKIAIILIV